ncbi:hypothetical protein AVEN_95114-1 [Araneus ventricosus]|uniref:Tc3 transposase DNA binding domain-containing protein n=1 Tax=Araneus ventricosus TaxID=182803 RepID=A0A4Y2I9K0_ARAVE|nr:hypothetical protein AVEN_95114-1 [Araneus ventricosus]
MPLGTNLSGFQKGKMVAFKSSGLTARQIATKLNRSRTVIYNFLKNPGKCGRQRHTGQAFIQLQALVVYGIFGDKAVPRGRCLVCVSFSANGAVVSTRCYVSGSFARLDFRILSTPSAIGVILVIKSL